MSWLQVSSSDFPPFARKKNLHKYNYIVSVLKTCYFISYGGLFYQYQKGYTICWVREDLSLFLRGEILTAVDGHVTEPVCTTKNICPVVVLFYF